MTWWDILEDRLGVRLTDDKAHRWEQELTAEHHEGSYGFKISNDELCGAVRWLADQVRAGKYNVGEKYTVERFASAIKWYRKTKAQERKGAWSLDTVQGYLNFLKAKMREAPDNSARWDILCDPVRECGAPRDSTLLECAQLEDWAREEWPRFEADVKAMKERMAAEAERVIGTAAALVKVPDEDDELPF